MFRLIFTIGIIAFVSMNLSAESWNDAGNYDISWYTTDTDIYVNSASELAGVAYLTNHNLTDFADQTIHIATDIDLNGKTWIPIGYNVIFKGSIHGHGHAITGMNVDSFKGLSGLIGQMKNSKIQDLSLSGSIKTSFFYSTGLLVGSASGCTFEDVNCHGEISIENQTISTSTSWHTEIHAGGIAGSVENCIFTDAISDFNQSLLFGKSGGYNCFGYIKLYAGGIAGYGTQKNEYLRCESRSSFDNTIYGYNASSYYTVDGASSFNCGGIIGYDSSSSSTFTSCLSKVTNYNGSHLSGNYDSAVFYVGGFGQLNGKIENSVTIVDSYSIRGHDYSWVAAWYHTSVTLLDCGRYKPSYIAGCYINNDISKTTSKIKMSEEKIFGSSSFSKEQMNSQSFLDELNFYSRLHMAGVENWELIDGKLSLKHGENGNNGIIDIPVYEDSMDDVEYYTLNGIRTINPVSGGIYIRRQGSKTTKIVY